MCEFCKPDKFGDGKEITRKIASSPIDMGDYANALQLELWLIGDGQGYDTKLQFGLSVSSNGEEIQAMDIPIKYCPMCGREL